jgi:hypothetical protein
MTMLRSTTAWQALAAHHETIKDVTLRELFASDATRGESLTAEGAGLFLDYSKNRITAETLQLLVQLAEERDLAGRRAAIKLSGRPMPPWTSWWACVTMAMAPSTGCLRALPRKPVSTAAA